MSITTYAELQTAITNWMGGRTDLTSFYPDWITIFEAHAARRLRVRPMESTVTLTVTSATATLPSDYLGWRRVTWTGSPNTNLEYAHPTWITEHFPDSGAAGTPSVFTIIDSRINVQPADDSSLSFTYFAKNTAVSSALNWLFTNFPDAYLFGALLEGANFTADTDQAIIWKSRRDEIMQELESLYFREPGPKRIRTAGVTP